MAMPRAYRLGRRRAGVGRTTAAIVAAARELVSAGAPASMAEIARRAGVSRATLYARFPRRSSVLAALRPPAPAVTGAGAEPDDALRQALLGACIRWAGDPALYRRLDLDDGGESARLLAQRLADGDALRPGRSLREAEDVIAVLTSFPVFDRLHLGGRRT